MQITSKEVDGILVVSIKGRLTVGSDGFFRSETAGFSEKFQKIVMDCSEMEYIDSTGLGLIVRFFKEFTDAGGKFVLAALQPKPKLVFEITSASKIFEIYENVEKALEALR